MVTTTQRIPRVPYEEIAGQAANIHVGRALAIAFAAVFMAIGWVAGRSVYSVGFAVASIRYGYRVGAKIKRVPAQPPGS